MTKDYSAKPVTRVRCALPSDSLAIAELHAASWRVAYRGALSDEYLAADVLTDRIALWKRRFSSAAANQYVVVAENDGALAGFACAYFNEDPMWGSLLDNIHVRPNAHRKGLGSVLLRAVAAQCSVVAREAGLYLWVLQDNASAQRFYEHHGARKAGADLWHAPGESKVPRFRFAWPAGQLPAQP